MEGVRRGMSSGFSRGTGWVHSGSATGFCRGVSMGFGSGYGVGSHRDIDRVF